MELEPIKVALISLSVWSEKGQAAVMLLEEAGLGAGTTIDLSAALDLYQDGGRITEHQ